MYCISCWQIECRTQKEERQIKFELKIEFGFDLLLVPMKMCLMNQELHSHMCMEELHGYSVPEQESFKLSPIENFHRYSAII